MKKIKGYKAFDKGLACREFQFEIGETYKHDGDIIACEKGFHFCENPLDVLDYYNLCESEFAEIEASGNIKKEKDKSVTDTLTIKTKLDLSAFIKASFDFIWTKFSKVSKDKKINAASGYGSQLAASGDGSQLAASGDRSQLAVEGNYSVGANIGVDGIIKGKKGSWITLAEYDQDYKPIIVISAQIDGDIIKENVFYKIKNKKIIEV